MTHPFLAAQTSTTEPTPKPILEPANGIVWSSVGSFLIVVLLIAAVIYLIVRRRRQLP